MKLLKPELIKILNILLFAACVILCSFYLIRMYEFRDFPAEYRDAAVFEEVREFSLGMDPYDADYLKSSEPPRVVLDSGFLNIFPALVFVKLFGMQYATAMYLTGFICLVLSMFLMGVCVKVLTGDLTLSLTGAVLIFFCMRRWGLLCVRPDTMAELLMLMVIYLILKDRSDIKTVLLIDLLLVATAYLKPHYALVGAAALRYMIKKKRFFIFAGGGVLIFSVSIIICNLLFPTHISVWGIRLYEMFTGVGSLGSSLGYALDKWKRLFLLFLPSFILFIYGACFEIKKILKNRGKSALTEADNNLAENESRGADRNLVYIWINAILNGLALTYLGRHDGADLWYFYFMLMPSVIMLSLYYLGKLMDRGPVRRSAVFLFGFLFLSLICLFNTFILLSPRPKYVNRWRESHKSAYDILKEHESDEMMLSSPLAYYATMNDIYNFNHGDLCYLPVTKTEGSFMEKLFPYVEIYEDKYNSYALDALKKLEEKEYSIVTVDSIDTPFEIFGLEEEFKKTLLDNYVLIDSFEVFVESQGMMTEFYVPKK